MDWNIDDYIKGFEEMGYTTEEAKHLIEEATRPVDISSMNEEFKEIIDKWCSIGCTSFRFTADELKKILEEQKKQKKEK